MPRRILFPVIAVLVVLGAFLLVEYGRTLGPRVPEPVPAAAPAPSSSVAVLERPTPDARAATAPIVSIESVAEERSTSGVHATGRVLGADGAPSAGAVLLLGVDALYPLADARPIGRTDEHGELVLEAPVEASDRNVAQHLFALTRDGLAWTRLRIGESTTTLRLGDFRVARTRTIVARVQDEAGNVLGGADVEARARFFPLAGLFDAEEPGFEPDDRVLALFRARTDGAGNATFERLPAPLDAGIYEFTASVPGFGRGSTLLERPTEAEGAPVRIVVAPPR